MPRFSLRRKITFCRSRHLLPWEQGARRFIGMDDQRKTLTNHARRIALLLLICMTGCSDFSQHRFGGIRRESPKVAGLVHPAPSLAIPNPPTTPTPSTTNLQQAGFVPADQPNVPLIPNPERTVAPDLRIPIRNSTVNFTTPQFGGYQPVGDKPLRMLHTRAVKTYTGMDSYNYRFTRRESVGGKLQPEELILVKIRRKPFSVSLRWLGDEGKGREVMYVDGKFGSKLQILTAPNEVFPFAPPTRFNFAPNDAMVKSKSRHSITESGFGNLIDNFGRLVAGIEAGDARVGTAKYLGMIERKEFPRPVEAVHHNLPPGADPDLPKGGQRWWYFDANHGLPVLVITHDETGEVEYYRHDLIQWPARLDDLDFDPSRMGKKQ